MSMFRSKAFLRGVMDGLASPYAFLARPVYARPARNLVESSWQTVGQSLYSVMSEKFPADGQTTRAKRRQPGAYLTRH